MQPTGNWLARTALCALVLSALLSPLGCKATSDSSAQNSGLEVNTAIASSVKVPAGIYVLNPPDKPVSPDVLASDLVAGVVLRGDWQTLQPSPGKLQLQYYREQLDRIQAAGKVASLVISSGGLNTPKFALDGAGETLKFEDDNRFHKATHGQQVQIPSFWDAKFLDYKKQFIRELGAQLGDHPALKLVSVQCANATTDDWNLPERIDWQKAGFSTAKLLKACEALIDQTAQSFPRQALRMAVGAMPRSLIDARDLPAEIWRYGHENYPGRFYIQRHNLAVNTPNPANQRRLMAWQLLYDAKPYSAAQFLWPVVDTKTCRMNGGDQPCNSEQMLQQISTVVAGYGFHYVEVYGADFEQLAGTGAMANLAAAIDGDGSTPAPAPERGRMRDAVGSRQAQEGMRTSAGWQRQTGGRAEAVANGNSIYGAWSNPPSGVETRSPAKHYELDSKLLATKVGFSLYLPEGYSSSGASIPVIYWLHGKQGNESRGSYIAQYLQSAIAERKIRPTAMVLVNGGLQSFYSNAKDGSAPVESMIMDELIPYVESQFNVGGSRDKRLLQGFSMGGFGALKLAAKYPEQFASVATFGAALLGADFLPQQRDADAYQNVFANDAEYFIENSPQYWLEKNRDKIKQLGLSIRMRVGDKDGTRRYNDHLVDKLRSWGIAVDYETFAGVAHAPRQYYDVDDAGSFAFEERNMASQ